MANKENDAKKSRGGVTKGIHDNGGTRKRSAKKAGATESEPQVTPIDFTPESIVGKAVVVAGGTTGIGKAVAKLLAERRARVLVFGRNRQAVNQTVQEITEAGGEGHGVVADMAKTADILRVFRTADRKLGGVDILINNAAVFAGSVADVDHEDIVYTVNVNVVGYMSCSHEAIARMRKKGSGHIINIGSISADVRESQSDIYVATKAAIQGFSASLRKTVNPLGIKVTLLEPGLVSTDLTSESTRGTRLHEKHQILDGRDIAEGVYYCLTQTARCDVISLQIRPHMQLI